MAAASTGSGGRSIRAPDTAERGTLGRMAYHPMSRSEVRDFLTALPARTAKLATTRKDGRPHVAPVWYAMDDDGTIVFNTDAATVKGRNLRRTAQAALCVDNDTPPFDFVTIEGTVVLSDDLDDVRRWATRIAGRYMGANRAEEYGARNGVPGELLVRLTPTRITSAANVAN